MKSAFVFAACVAVLPATTARAAAITFNDFSSAAGLQINGDALTATDSGNRSVLRLTRNIGNQSGSAFSTDLQSLDSNASFSTFFSFNLNGSGGLGGGADGIVFVLQTVSNTAGSVGGGIGYFGLPDSVGVEFDTYDNGDGLGDPDANHVGIDLEGSVFSVETATPAFIMESGDDRFAWIDYDGTTDQLEVRISENDIRPLNALLTRSVDFVGSLGSTDAYAGFTAGTGAGYANHDILTWQFRTNFDPIGDGEGEDDPDQGSSSGGVTSGGSSGGSTGGGTNVPEPTTLALFGLGLAVAGRLRRR